MKVLKDNYTTIVEEIVQKPEKPYPRKMVCENCGSELEYEKSDLRLGALGCAFVDCPLCSHDNLIDEDGVTLTVDNVEFPVHFWHTCVEKGAKDACNNEEVKQCIRKAIDYFRKNKNEYHWFTCYGNLYIGVTRWDGDENYEVVVTNNYYNTYIPFEKLDYSW